MLNGVGGFLLHFFYVIYLNGYFKGFVRLPSGERPSFGTPRKKAKTLRSYVGLSEVRQEPRGSLSTKVLSCRWYFLPLANCLERSATERLDVRTATRKPSESTEIKTVRAKKRLFTIHLQGQFTNYPN